jgi:hypothetical protein
MLTNGRRVGSDLLRGVLPDKEQQHAMISMFKFFLLDFLFNL